MVNVSKQSESFWFPSETSESEARASQSKPPDDCDHQLRFVYFASINQNCASEMNKFLNKKFLNILSNDFRRELISKLNKF